MYQNFIPNRLGIKVHFVTFYLTRFAAGFIKKSMFPSVLNQDAATKFTSQCGTLWVKNSGARVRPVAPLCRFTT